MIITVNGQNKEFQGNLNLSVIIKNFCKQSQYVIAEVNGNIIKKNLWDQTTVRSGDQIELVSFVGGG